MIAVIAADPGVLAGSPGHGSPRRPAAQRRARDRALPAARSIRRASSSILLANSATPTRTYRRPSCASAAASQPPSDLARQVVTVRPGQLRDCERRPAFEVVGERIGSGVHGRDERGRAVQQRDHGIAERLGNACFGAVHPPIRCNLSTRRLPRILGETAPGCHSDYTRPVRSNRDALARARAAHAAPALVDPDRTQIVNAGYRTGPLREVFGYEPAWPVVSEARRSQVAELIGTPAPASMTGPHGGAHAGIFGAGDPDAEHLNSPLSANARRAADRPGERPVRIAFVELEKVRDGGRRRQVRRS
jgi:hypothetical protein